jgi:DNA adenine methylase
MNCYVAIRNNLDSLVERLEDFQERARDKKFYYDHARPRFNKIGLVTGLEGNVEKAALLIYLNKTCYNGLYRVNRKGDFNVPWGDYKSPRIYDEDTLRAAQNWLRRPDIEMKCGDYKEHLSSAKEGDFIYLDPPYQPVSSTSNFTDYTSGGFKLWDQKGLASTVVDLDAMGCLVMVSNSAHRYVKQFYDKIGRKGCLQTVYASRAISSVGSGRGKIAEYLITNYKVN